MIHTLKKYCDELVNTFESISPERKALLEKIAAYVSARRKENKPVNLIYVCTHNSRRSHFGQIWAKVAASYFNVSEIKTYSGGTEATAFNQNAINALKRVGFEIKQADDSANPVYQVFYDQEKEPVICFSKVYDHPNNPHAEFAAIMTCSDAEENCPFIPGVDLRIATTYDDPKAFDNTPLQDAKYDERCRQIACETFFVFYRVSKLNQV